MKRMAWMAATMAAVVLGFVWPLMADPDDDAPPPPEQEQPRPFLGGPKPLARMGAEAAGDLVVTQQGSRIVGTVVSVDSGGTVTVKGAEFSGEVRVAAGAVRDIRFARTEADAGPHEVLLVSGDRLRGTLQSITSAEVAIDTSSAGRLKISPDKVASVRMAQPRDVLVDTDFAAGEGGPWKTRGLGSFWTFGDDGLSYMAPWRDDPPLAPVFMPLGHKEAVTMIVKIRPPANPDVSVVMVLGSEGKGVTGKLGDNEQDASSVYGPDCVMATFNRNVITLFDMSRQGDNDTFSFEISQPVMDWTLRLAYDPQKGKARAWIGDQGIGEFVIKSKPPNPQIVMFNAQSSVVIESVKVLRGVVAPSKDQPKAESGRYIQFTNGDHVTFTGISLDGGKVTLATVRGEIRSGLDTVAAVVMAGVTEPAPPAKGRVVVTTSGGRLAMTLDRLTDKEVVGRSDVLGEVHLRRAAVREIDFSSAAEDKTEATPK
jgi:hypothetical protein